MTQLIRRRITGLVLHAGAIVLETTWVCTSHGTVNAQGTTCARCTS